MSEMPFNKEIQTDIYKIIDLQGHLDSHETFWSAKLVPSCFVIEIIDAMLVVVERLKPHAKRPETLGKYEQELKRKRAKYEKVKSNGTD